VYPQTYDKVPQIPTSADAFYFRTQKASVARDGPKVVLLSAISLYGIRLDKVRWKMDSDAQGLYESVRLLTSKPFPNRPAVRI